jgi:hypothetical protein
LDAGAEERARHERALDREVCRRWDGNTFLVATLDGRLDGVHASVCNSPNKCGYCARRVALENVKMLELDVHRGPGPEILLVLTTPAVTLDMSRFYGPLQQVMRALRLRWPVRYCSLLEYTTGHAPRSGGQRRPHLNVLLKGVAPQDADPVRELVHRVWCPQTGAVPEATYAAPIRDVGGLSKYVAAHFQKTSQRPPDGFKGQRFNPSKGRWRYWNGDLSTADMREQASRALALEALRYQGELKGLTGAELEAWITAEMERRDQLDWSVYRIKLNRWGEQQVQWLGGKGLRREDY